MTDQPLDVRDPLAQAPTDGAQVARSASSDQSGSIMLPAAAAPEAGNDRFQVLEGSIAGGNVIAGGGAGGADRDEDDDPLRVIEVAGNAANVGNSVTLSAGIRTTIEPDGDITIDASALQRNLPVGEKVETSVNYTVFDGESRAAARVDITVTGINEDPIAADDRYDLVENERIENNVISGTGAGEDRDPDGDALRVESVAGVEGNVGRRLTLESGLEVRVDRNGDILIDARNLEDDLSFGEPLDTTLTYTLADRNGGFDTGAIVIRVNGLNEVPLAVDDTLAIDEGESGSVDLVNGPGADSDADGNPLRVVAVDDKDANVGTPYLLASGASVLVSANGLASYDSSTLTANLAAGETLVERIDYRIEDSAGATASARLEVTVRGLNDLPVAADDRIEVIERKKVKTNVIEGDAGNGGDIDPDGGKLTVTSVNEVERNVGRLVELENGLAFKLSRNGTLSVDARDFSDNLAQGETAVSSVTYVVADREGARADAQIDIVVTGVNDPPSARDDLVEVREGRVAAIDLISGGGADTDPDGDRLVVVSVDGKEANVGEVLTLSSGATLTIEANGRASVDASVLERNLRAGETREETIRYKIGDPGGLGSAAEVTVTITGVNESPLATDDRLQVGEGQTIDANIVDGRGGALADTDPDGDPLSVAAVDDRAGLVGTPIVLGSGLIVTIDESGRLSADASALANDLAEDVVRNERLTYRVDDGEGGSAIGNVLIELVGLPESGGGEIDAKDRLSGGDADDTLFGLGGNDRLEGREGNDLLDGGTGNDRLKGNAGEDTLIGGADKDRLDGGEGADTYVFDPGSGIDKVRFVASEDVLDLRGYRIGFAALDSDGDTALTRDDEFVTARKGDLLLDLGAASGGDAGIDVLVVTVDGTIGADNVA